MSKLKTGTRLINLLITLFLLALPLAAQQKRVAVPKKPAAPEAPEPAPSFDNLIAADTYRIYGEIRSVGGLIRSPAVSDLLDPVMKLAGPPKEFKSVVKWLNAHAETLASSRILVAGWPSRPKLPTILIAIEFSSAEEAQKFEPQLRGFIPTLLPTPAPTPATSPNPDKPTPPVAPVAQSREAELPPYRIKQSGSLVLLSDQSFEFRDLTPRGSKLLGEDQDFAMARNRFASESLFLYVDVKSIEKEEQERRKKYEEEEQKRIETEAANPPKEEPTQNGVDSEMARAQLEELPPQSPELAPTSSGQAPLETTSPTQESSSNAHLTAVPYAGPDPLDAAFMSLTRALFGGEPKWPEAIGAAVAFEGDGYVVRALLVNSEETKSNPIPFVPQFVSGPPLLPMSSNVFPADTSLFAAVSLDYAQIYEGTLKAIAGMEESARKYNRRAAGEVPPQSPLAVYEKKLGLKIKDDVLPLFGNEIALALLKPRATASPASPGTEQAPTEKSEQKPSGPFDPKPVVAISIKDREAVKLLIPKLIDSAGIKGANLLAQTEKRDDTEIISYANLFAYAFIGDFLVLSSDAGATRQVVDSYLSHQTLSSDSHFRNSSRWQPRQLLGQVYIAPSLIDLYYPPGGRGATANDKMREFLSGTSPFIEPLTYALSNEGVGPLHELHVPKSLLMLMVAGISSEASEAPLVTNEAVARGLLRTVVSAEATFHATKGDGHFGTLDELLSEGLINKDVLEKYGYKLDLMASSNKFEATATPREYGKTGRLSFFIDESGVLREGDHGGGAATISDQPAQ